MKKHEQSQFAITRSHSVPPLRRAGFPIQTGINQLGHAPSLSGCSQSVLLSTSTLKQSTKIGGSRKPGRYTLFTTCHGCLRSPLVFGSRPRRRSPPSARVFLESKLTRLHHPRRSNLLVFSCVSRTPGDVYATYGQPRKGTCNGPASSSRGHCCYRGTPSVGCKRHDDGDDRRLAPRTGGSIATMFFVLWVQRPVCPVAVEDVLHASMPLTETKMLKSSPFVGCLSLLTGVGHGFLRAFTIPTLA